MNCFCLGDSKLKILSCAFPHSRWAKTLGNLDSRNSMSMLHLFDRLDLTWNSIDKLLKDLAKYAEEANHMHGENSKKAKELAELHCQLATNMGHQNQRQKIKYMVSCYTESRNQLPCLFLDQNQARATRDKRKALGQGVRVEEGQTPDWSPHGGH